MQFLEKMVTDQELFDVDCTDLLDDSEVILSCGAPVIDDESSVTFGTPVINAAPIDYPLLGRVAQIGKALQVMIIGGELPDGAPSGCYNVRFPLVTSFSPARSVVVCLKLVTGDVACEC